ncbi:hypothetical protein [Vibrio ezurae]|uniref:Lipoprotein n=1 Tax=Vibrio ezurae NBRC 102218 TaxID=1219080 RepID=U3AH21_9VIBR|nr:hypothetical protein [Vibrio ezurae]GAD79216.1 hypothetical protein VEZ01S_08_02520 [Vibrio ezurae NBRC 102218]
MKLIKKYPLLAGSLLLTTLILSGCGGGGSDSTPKTTELTLNIQNQEQVTGVFAETVGLYIEIQGDYNKAREGVRNYYDHGHFLVDSGSAKWTYNTETTILDMEFNKSQFKGADVILNGSIKNLSASDDMLVANLNAHNLSSGLTLQSSYQSTSQSDFSMTTTSSQYGSYKVVATDFDKISKGQGEITIIGKDNQQWVLDFYPGVYTVTEPDGSSYNVNIDNGQAVKNQEFAGIGQGSMSSFVSDDDSSTVASLVDDGFTAITSFVKTFRHDSYYLADGFCSDGGSYSTTSNYIFNVKNCNENGVALNGNFKDEYENEYSNIDLDIHYINTDEDGHLTANTIDFKKSVRDSNYNHVDEIKFVGQYSDAQSNNQYVVLKSSDIYFDDQSFGLDYPKSGKILVSTGGKTWTADLHGSTFDLTSPNGTTTQHTLSLMD